MHVRGGHIFVCGGGGGGSYQSPGGFFCLQVDGPISGEGGGGGL